MKLGAAYIENMRCQAKNRTGDQCRNNAIRGTKFCYVSSHGAFGKSFLSRAINYVGNHPVLALIALGVGIISLWLYIRDRESSSMSGVLKSPGEAARKYVSVGSTRFVVDAPDNVLLRDGDRPILSLRSVDRRLLVSTEIRNSAGELIAELTDNEWRLNRDLLFDRNYTSQALEVRDRAGRITLQVVDFGDTIHLAGIFRCRNGWSTVLAPAGEQGAVMDMKGPGEEPKYEISPICEYPSDQHFGICPGIDSLSKLINHDPHGSAY
jgi:hypothetical protein